MIPKIKSIKTFADRPIAEVSYCSVFVDLHQFSNTNTTTTENIIASTLAWQQEDVIRLLVDLSVPIKISLPTHQSKPLVDKIEAYLKSIGRDRILEEMPEIEHLESYDSLR